MVYTITEPDNTIPCVFCKSPIQDEVNLGPMYKTENVACHYFCMLFAAGLNQTGSDSEGILGFMPEAILKEVRRGSRLKCTFCNMPGAAVGCCKKACKIMCHFPCGLSNGGIQFQFLKNYEAYCTLHAIHQEIPDKFYTSNANCPICLCTVDKEEDLVLASCCQSAVFHKDCLKRAALNAGYFFKCPMCNAKKEFVQEMRRVGVFVPEQDASWEREPGAFADLLYQYSKCDAATCECSKGREYSASKGDFILARCRICAAAGVHRKCGNLKTVARWACAPCAVLEAKAKAEKKAAKRKPIAQSPSTSQSSSPQNGRQNHRLFQGLRKELAVQEEEEEEIDFAKITISSTCASYFPFSPEQLGVFQRSAPPVIPDWRGFTLRSNVVDWLGDFMRKSAGITTPPPKRLPPNADLKIPPVILGPRPELPETSASVTTTPIGKNQSVHSKKRRRTKWSGGTIRKKRRIAIAANFGKLKLANDTLEPETATFMPNGVILKSGVSESEIFPIINSENKTEATVTFSDKRRNIIELSAELLAFGSKRDPLIAYKEDKDKTNKCETVVKPADSEPEPMNVNVVNDEHKSESTATVTESAICKIDLVDTNDASNEETQMEMPGPSMSTQSETVGIEIDTSSESEKFVETCLSNGNAKQEINKEIEINEEPSSASDAENLQMDIDTDIPTPFYEENQINGSTSQSQLCEGQGGSSVTA